MILKEDIEKLLKGKYAVVIDGPEKIYINENEPFNPASTIKLYILYAALKAIDEKKFNLYDIIHINEEEIVPGAGVIQRLEARKYKLSDLITLMVAYSDNTATNVILDLLSISFIQNVVTSLGLDQTFVRRKLYHIIPGIYNSTCARDLNSILHFLYQGHGLSQEMKSFGLQTMGKQTFKTISLHLRTCGNCGKLLTNNLCSCGCFSGDIDPVNIETYSKSGEITGHVHDSCIMVIDEPIYISILTSQQDNNQATRETLSEVGLIIYKYFKAFLC